MQFITSFLINRRIYALKKLTKIKIRRKLRQSQTKEWLIITIWFLSFAFITDILLADLSWETFSWMRSGGLVYSFAINFLFIKGKYTKTQPHSIITTIEFWVEKSLKWLGKWHFKDMNLRDLVFGFVFHGPLAGTFILLLTGEESTKISTYFLGNGAISIISGLYLGKIIIIGKHILSISTKKKSSL